MIKLNNPIHFLAISIILVVPFINACKDDTPPAPLCEISLIDDAEGTYAFNDTIKVFASVIDFYADVDQLRISVNDSKYIIEEYSPAFEFQLSHNDLVLGENSVEYNVIDINGSVGSDRVEFELLSDQPRITIDTVFIDNNNTVNVLGKLLSGGGIETSWGICFSETSEPSYDQNRRLATDSLFTATISKEELEYGKKYFVRTWAKNDNGIAYGKEFQFIIHDYSFMTDARDSKEYKIIDIGGLTWMAENLAWEGDGKNVINISNADTWATSTNGYTYYLNNKDAYENYGVYYQFDAAQNACPSGWHLPSPEEWENLAQSAGGKAVAGIALKSINGWNEEGNGDNTLGFNILPAGFRHNDGSWGWSEGTLGKYGMFWANEEHENGYYATFLYCTYDNDELSVFTEILKQRGKNVRCVKD